MPLRFSFHAKSAMRITEGMRILSRGEIRDYGLTDYTFMRN